MQIKLCPLCKRPFLAKYEACPKCPALRHHESWMSIGCLIALILPLLFMIFFWIVLILGFFMQ